MEVLNWSKTWNIQGCRLTWWWTLWRLTFISFFRRSLGGGWDAWCCFSPLCFWALNSTSWSKVVKEIIHVDWVIVPSGMKTVKYLLEIVEGFYTSSKVVSPVWRIRSWSKDLWGNCLSRSDMESVICSALNFKGSNTEIREVKYEWLFHPGQAIPAKISICFIHNIHMIIFAKTGCPGEKKQEVRIDHWDTAVKIVFALPDYFHERHCPGKKKTAFQLG